jgi:hypothetical protein
LSGRPYDKNIDFEKLASMTENSIHFREAIVGQFKGIRLKGRKVPKLRHSWR